MSVAFRLVAGDRGPVQQSPVTCGSASLTVARMLLDPLFAQWVQTGQPHLPGSPLGHTYAERFAAYERVVMARTNGLWLRGRTLNPWWPHALGTPPWGAKHELEYGAATRGTSYAIELLRSVGADARRTAYDRLVEVVADGEPGLLYVGNLHLPRHVVLVLPSHGDKVLDVYEPASGQVRVLRRDEFVDNNLALAGWDVPWLSVQPDGARRARVPAPPADAGPVPA